MSASLAARFLVDQIWEPSGSSSQDRDRIRHLVRYAVRTGRLRSNAEGKINFGELVVWARSQDDLREALSDYSSLDPTRVNAACLPGQSSSGGHAVPAAPDERAAALSDAYARIWSTERQLADQAVELKILRPLGIVKEARRLKGAISGKKGGRGHTK